MAWRASSRYPSGDSFSQESGMKRVAHEDLPSSECQTYSMKQAWQKLGISRGSAYALANKGKLPTIRLGRRLVVPKVALDRLLSGDAEAA
jgi:excisionase family DNA binding protein